MKFRSSLDKYRRGKPALVGQKLATVKIESLNQQGEGVAHIDGQAVFIAHTAPGDEAQVRIVKKHKRWLRATVEHLIKPSEQRCEPKCPYVPQCGGCSWQHINYEHQLTAKETQLPSTLRHIGGIEHITVKHIVASPKPFAYRNRIRGVLQNNQFHFHANGSTELVAVARCAIADDRINAWLADPENTTSSEPEAVELAISGDEVHRSPISDDRTTALGFRQGNEAVSTELTRAVSAVINRQLQSAPQPTSTLLDLYCGQGSWSVQIANAHPNLQVKGIDVSADNIRCAQRWAKGIRNLSFCTQTAERALADHNMSADFCIVDPPRAGLSTTVIDALNANPVDTLVYVSCHPASLARDLAALSSSAYCIDSVQPFDMFPQTAHVETLAVLHKL